MRVEVVDSTTQTSTRMQIAQIPTAGDRLLGMTVVSVNYAATPESFSDAIAPGSAIDATIYVS